MAKTDGSRTPDSPPSRSESPHAERTMATSYSPSQASHTPTRDLRLAKRKPSRSGKSGRKSEAKRRELEEGIIMLDAAHAELRREGKVLESLAHLEKSVFLRRECYGADSEEVDRASQVYLPDRKR